jgi:hypothetical protein
VEPVVPVVGCGATFTSMEFEVATQFPLSQMVALYTPVELTVIVGVVAPVLHRMLTRFEGPERINSTVAISKKKGKNEPPKDKGKKGK